MSSILENIDEIIIADMRKESFVKKSIFTFFYIGMYQYIHLYYLSEVWSYMRYFKNELDFIQILLMYIVALFPIYFYSGLTKISSYFSILIYFLAYIPIIVTLSYNNTDEFGYQTVFLYQAVLAFSMSCFFAVDKIKKQKTKKLQFRLSIAWFHFFAIIITAYLLYRFSGNMRFVGFNDVYALRSENSQTADSISMYFTMWATYFVYPIYFSMGIVNKQIKNILIGAFGHIIIYMITGSKASVLMPIIIFLIYITITRIKHLSFSQSLAIFISCISLLLFWVEGDALFTIRSIFLMRTLSMPGYLFSNYLSFFSNHPTTNYSHIGIVNALTNSYPYGDDPIGVVIGNFDMTNANANANFWATDGVAAHGLLGIFIITIIMVIFFMFMNNLLQEKKTLFIYLTFTGIVFSLLNISFFTTCLSGGLFLLLFLLFAIDFDEKKTTK